MEAGAQPAFFPPLAWESSTSLAQQHEFASPSELLVQGLSRRFLTWHEQKLSSFQRDNLLTYRFLVQDEINPDEDPTLNELFHGFLTVGKSGCVSPLLRALLAWRTERKARKVELTNTLASALTKEHAKTAKALLEEIANITTEFLFCKLALMVLPTVDKKTNDLDKDVGQEVEAACFNYLETNRSVTVSSKGKETGEVLENKRLLFDLFSELLGKLSVYRFSSVTDRFFSLVEESCSSKDVSPAVAITYALRYLHLDISTPNKQKQTLAFVERIRDNYFDPKSKKQLKDLQIALFELLYSVLAPLIESKQGSKVDAKLQTDWLDALVELFKKVEAYSKKVKNKEAAIYPLQTVVLCVASNDFMDQQMPDLLEKLLKITKPGDKLKGMGLECIYRLLLAFLVKREPEKFTDLVKQVTGKLFPSGNNKKGHIISSPEECVDIIVDIIHLISITQLDYAAQEIILPLLKDKVTAYPERITVGLLAFNAIVDRLVVRPQQLAEMAGLYVHNRKHSRKLSAAQLGVTTKDFRRETLRRNSRKIDEEISAALAEFVKNVSKALDQIIGDLDELLGTRNNYLLVEPKYAQKDILDLIGKDKVPVLTAHHTAISALRRTQPSKMTSLDLASMLARYTLHIDPVIRHEAFHVLLHIVTYIPALRLIVVEEFSKFIASISVNYEDHIEASLKRLVDLLDRWTAILVEVKLNRYDRTHEKEEQSKFSEAEVEGTAIVFFCSSRPSVRKMAFSALQSLNALNAALPGSQVTQNKLLMPIITTLHDTITQTAHIDIARIPPVKKHGSTDKPRFTFEDLMSDGSAEKQVMWSRALGKLLLLALSEAPDSVSVALRHVVARLPAIQSAIDSHKGTAKGPDVEYENNVSVWRNYAVVACATCASCGGNTEQEATSSPAIFQSILPFLKSTPAMADALILALSFVQCSVFPVLFDKLAPYLQEVYASQKVKSKPKDHIMRLRSELALISRLTSESFQDRPFQESNALLHSFVEWIKFTRDYLEIISTENSLALQALRYDFFVTLARSFVEINSSAPDKLEDLFPGKIRRKLFEFIVKYSGHVPDYLRENLGREWFKKSDVGELEQADYDKRNRSVEHAALRAMAATLMGGAFYDLKVEQDKRGPIFGWLTKCFESHDDEVHAIGKWAINVYLQSNLEHEDELFVICTDLCYDSNQQVSKGYFEAAAHIVSSRDINYTMATILNVCLLKVGDDVESVRHTAMAVLSHVTNSPKYNVSPIPGVSQTSAALQLRLSTMLSQDYPQLAYELFSSVWYRVVTIEEKAGHVQMLYYLPPWLQQIDLSALPKDRTAPFLQNLSIITHRYGRSYPQLVEKLWSSLVDSVEQNLAVILDFLVLTAVETRSVEFLPTARQIAVCVARVKPEASMERLVTGGLYDTFPVKLEHDAPEGEEGKPETNSDNEEEEEAQELSDAEEAPLSWAFELIFPVNKKTKYANSRSDICLILLIELAIEHIEVLQKYLPTVLHAAFIGLDALNPIVHNNCKLLITNILHALVTQHEGIKGSSPVLELIDQIKSLGDGPAWKNEDTTISDLDIASAKEISTWINRVIKVLPFCTTLVTDWGNEALAWAAKIGRVPAHYVYRSFQIYRALVALGCELTKNALGIILSIFYKHEAKRPLDRIGLAIDIMQVFLVVIEAASPSELLRFPHMFWSIWAVLYTDYEQEFLYAVKVIAAYVNKLDFNDKEVQNVFLSSVPDDKVAPFLGLQPMVLKGLTSKVAEAESRHLLINLISLTPTPLIEQHANPRKRYLTSLVGLLPWALASITEAGDEVASALNSLSGRFREVKLDQLADALDGFLSLHFESDDEFLSAVAASIGANFFPAEELFCFTLLVEIFRLGVPTYQKPVIRILRALARHIDWQKSALKEAGIPLFNCLITTPHWKEVLPLTSLLVQNLPVHADINKADDAIVIERLCDFDKVPRTWTSEDRGKAMVSNALFCVVSPLEEAEGSKLPKPPTVAAFVFQKQSAGGEPVVAVAPSPRKGSHLRVASSSTGSLRKEKDKSQDNGKGKKVKKTKDPKKGEKKKKDKKTKE